MKSNTFCFAFSVYRKVSYYVPKRELKRCVVNISFLTFLNEDAFGWYNIMMALTYGVS